MQSDYILRMIEQFGRFAAALRRALLGGGEGAGGAKADLLSLAQHAGLDLDLARAATPDTLALLVAPGGEVEPGRCWMCAETLYLDGLDASLDGDVERALASWDRALRLFALVAPRGAFLVGFPEAADRIAEIEDRIAALERGPPPEPGHRAARPRRRRAPRSAA